MFMQSCLKLADLLGAHASATETVDADTKRGIGYGLNLHRAHDQFLNRGITHVPQETNRHTLVEYLGVAPQPQQFV